MLQTSTKWVQDQAWKGRKDDILWIVKGIEMLPYDLVEYEQTESVLENETNNFICRF